MITLSDSPAARAMAACKAGRWEDAAATVGELVRSAFGLDVLSVEIARDGYSLNSVNGFVRVRGSGDFFFKFHHEEGEELTLQELYRGELLRDAGFPVDMPAFVSREVGRQLLLYRRRRDPRFADVCRQLEFSAESDFSAAVNAQVRLDRLTAQVFLRTLHQADAAVVADEPVHQLFYHRLARPAQPEAIGGRARRFFWGEAFDLAGALIPADRLRASRWRINGVEFEDTLEDLFDRSLELLHPRSLARFGAVVAHGDSHNANIWWEERADRPVRLVYFDPAFAGAHVPALLAEVKATFHNVFAHPLWLYAPQEASRRYRAQVSVRGDAIEVRTDWQVSALRASMLRAKAEHLWGPLLRELRARGLLPGDWRETLRCALFCCPALVMDLRAGGAGGHTPLSSAIGLAVAVAVGSRPLHGERVAVSDFLESIDPAR